ncbi:DUF3973 domain-containing protein [Tumebacillus permanentifrigoris]|uniref:DUF3973 domain-containing protein n=1 Tax=Tumebacillus permanentifrigoris TaxID=378543 RepID=UPI0014732626
MFFCIKCNSNHERGPVDVVFKTGFRQITTQIKYPLGVCSSHSPCNGKNRSA